MKTLPLLLFAFVSLSAHAETGRTVTATGRGLIPFHHFCSPSLFDNARSLAVVDAIQQATSECGGNVRQLTPFEETDDCDDSPRQGSVTMQASFTCLAAAAGSRVYSLTSSYATSAAAAQGILFGHQNARGEGLLSQEADSVCGGSGIRIRPYEVKATIDPSLPEDRNMTVLTASVFECGAEPELMN